MLQIEVQVVGDASRTLSYREGVQSGGNAYSLGLNPSAGKISYLCSRAGAGENTRVQRPGTEGGPRASAL